MTQNAKHGMEKERIRPWWQSGWQWARLAGIGLFGVGATLQVMVWLSAAVIVSESYWGWDWALIEDLLASVGIPVGEAHIEKLLRIGFISGMAAHLVFLMVAGVRLTHRLPILLCLGWAMAVGPGLMFCLMVNTGRVLARTGTSKGGLVLWAIAGLGVWLLPLAAFWAWGKREQTGWRLVRFQVWFLGACVLPGVVAVILAVVSKEHWRGRFAQDVNFLMLFFSGAMFLMSLVGAGVLFWLNGDKVDLISEIPTLECFKCGYDLRGSIAGGRRLCPECGKEMSPAQREEFEKSEKLKHSVG
jgi:hypothetical protein